MAPHWENFVYWTFLKKQEVKNMAGIGLLKPFMFKELQEGFSS